MGRGDGAIIVDGAAHRREGNERDAKRASAGGHVASL